MQEVVITCHFIEFCDVSLYHILCAGWHEAGAEALAGRAFASGLASIRRKRTGGAGAKYRVRAGQGPACTASQWRSDRAKSGAGLPAISQQLPWQPPWHSICPVHCPLFAVAARDGCQPFVLRHACMRLRRW